MKKITFLLAILISLFQISYAQNEEISEEETSELMETLKKVSEKEASIKYDTGSVKLNDEIELKVPQGYKFMHKADAEYVVFDYWGNPRSEGVLGLLVSKTYTLLSDEWAFVVSAENSGYVKDEDADDIDYDELLEQLNESEEEENKQRTEAGYPSIHTAGWAAKPYYDKENNILHWAKTLVFNRGSAEEDSTLNYDVRVLGRKGLLSLNAVGSMDQLGDVQKHIPEIIHIAKFTEGNTYADFDPSVDKVAAYTIGGLVAGKLLAKAGILALILKNIKLIALGAIAFFGSFRKKIARLFGRKEEEEEEDPITADINSNSDLDRDVSNQENL